MSARGLLLLALLAVGGRPADQVVLSGTADVPRGSEVGEVVVLHGSASVAGVAHGDVVVIDGPIRVTGQVSGSVVAVRGSVRLGPDAQVGEDVVASGRVSVAHGAMVGGRIREHATFSWRGSVQALGGFAVWVAVSLSTLLLGVVILLLAPRGVEAVASALLGSPWRSLGLGVGLAIGLPVLAVLAIVSLVGLPFGLALLLALALLYWIALAAAEIGLGRLLWPAPRSRWLALLIGWAIVSAATAIPFAGGAIWIVGSILGLGSAILAIGRARGGAGRHRGGRAPSAAPARFPGPEPGAGL